MRRAIKKIFGGRRSSKRSEQEPQEPQEPQESKGKGRASHPRESQGPKGKGRPSPPRDKPKSNVQEPKNYVGRIQLQGNGSFVERCQAAQAELAKIGRIYGLDDLKHTAPANNTRQALTEFPGSIRGNIVSAVMESERHLTQGKAGRENGGYWVLLNPPEGYSSEKGLNRNLVKGYMARGQPFVFELKYTVRSRPAPGSSTNVPPRSAVRPTEQGPPDAALWSWRGALDRGAKEREAAKTAASKNDPYSPYQPPTTAPRIPQQPVHTSRTGGVVGPAQPIPLQEPRSTPGSQRGAHIPSASERRGGGSSSGHTLPKHRGRRPQGFYEPTKDDDA